jgi:hypothetical protein
MHFVKDNFAVCLPSHILLKEFKPLLSMIYYFDARFRLELRRTIPLT